MAFMGKQADVMLNTILPGASEEEKTRLFDEVIAQYQILVPDMKPYVFEGVHEGLERLSGKYKLYLLSNCEEGGLVHFMNHTKTGHLFIDYMEHGQNLQPKSFNMKLLAERNRLQYPVYIGDTDSDGKASATAGVPFVYMTYGFGKTDVYALKFDSFPELTDYFLNL